LFVYVTTAVLLAEIVGVMRLGAKSRAKLLDWVGKDVELSDDPIWWMVLDTGLRQSGRKEVFLNVRMADDSTYSGVLLHFPVLGDDVTEKDFAIWKARHYVVGQPVVELGSDRGRAPEHPSVQSDRGALHGPGTARTSVRAFIRAEKVTKTMSTPVYNTADASSRVNAP